MNKEEITSVLEQLKDGTRSELTVSKEDFLTFRQVLVARDDFKHFKGTARRGGDIVYQYLQDPRKYIPALKATL